MKKAEFEKTFNSLIGILKGMTADNVIDETEIEELQNWCILHYDKKDRSPFNEIIPIIEASIEDGILTDDEIEDILWVCNNYVNKNQYYDIITSKIQELQGILHGIMSDNYVSETELRYLKNWLDENYLLETVYPYDEIYSLVFDVLRDGKIDLGEQLLLKAFFVDFIDTTASYNINKGEYEEYKKNLNISGLCALAPNIEFDNRAFCFTGESRKVKRKDFAEIVQKYNGIFHKNVRMDTNYLVVGDAGNPCWAFSCYGRKVEKAMQLRKKGKDILIVHEVDFWDAIG